MNPILHNLVNLTNFSDRQTRGQFWPYALTILALMFVVNAAIFIPVLTESMERMRAFAAEHPELATVQRTATSESISIRGRHPELMPDFGLMIVAIGALAVAAVLLLAAAVTRRLHDRGKSGLWGLAPLVLLVSGFAIMSALFRQFGQSSVDLTLFGVGFINNALYLASLVTLIIWLVGPGAPSENRYGAAPLTPPR